MKPKLRFGATVIVFAVAVGVLVYAGLNATTYSPTIKPAATQSLIAMQLKQKTEPAKLATGHGYMLATSTNTPNAQNKIAARTDGNNPNSVTSPTQLANTGSGNVLLIFVVISLAATTISWTVRAKRALRLYS